MTSIVELVAHLGERVGLPGLALNVRGTLALQVGERLTLHLHYDEVDDTLEVFAPLGTLPAPGREALLMRMLRANRRQAVGLLQLDESEPPGVEIAYRTRCGAETGEALERALLALVNAALDWQARIEGHSSEHGASQEPGAVPHWVIRG